MFKVFIWLGLVVALLLISSKVFAVEDLAESRWLEETTEKNGVNDPKNGVSPFGDNFGSVGCCVDGL
ncbi:hypothetical protein MKW94_007940 [Papaver nudicaule]|uniref:Uncharacterized protein n=1 Tax=Papaver nudicaule TaxID=74823 RepID=A0AA41SFC3_PAPNU|nr:hypothetical protein [Papaver nudicaule]